MREITVRIRFTKPCLGSVKKYTTDQNSGRRWPYFVMPRTPQGSVRFEAKWWKSSLQFAATVLCRHQKAIKDIHFDICVDGTPSPEVRNFYKRYFDARRFVKHEAFQEGDTIGINCVVPMSISDEDFWRLMDLVGRFRGISPFGPQEYGFFTVESVTRKNIPTEVADDTTHEDDPCVPGREHVETSTSR